MAYDPENIFAKILDGYLPATAICEDDQTFAFADINPQASKHYLVLPKGKYTDLSDFAARASDAEIVAWVKAIAKVADQVGVAEDGYRVIVNIGKNAHQEVPHLHGHVLGGAPLGPMLPRNT